MFLIDTNLLSELRLLAVGRTDRQVAAWARQQNAQTFYISAMTIFEAERGIRRLERRDPAQGAILRGWMTSGILSQYSDRILPVDDRVAALAATYHVPDPAPLADSLIAATAVIHGLTVATRNAGDFRFPGVAVLNPWEA